ncbi:MAG: DUF4339 domain-containing protein [Verrucomicrobiota bacterium]
MNAKNADYFIKREDESLGPFTAKELTQMWDQGRLNAQDRYRTVGTENWLPVAGLVSAIKGSREEKRLRVALQCVKPISPLGFILPIVGALPMMVSLWLRVSWLAALVSGLFTLAAVWMLLIQVKRVLRKAGTNGRSELTTGEQ